VWGLLPVGSARCPVRFSRWSRRSGVVAVDRPLWRRGSSPTTALSEDVDHALQNALNSADIRSFLVDRPPSRKRNLGQRPAESEASEATKSCLQVTRSKADKFDPSSSCVAVG
jgi:hypothetical protein